MSSHSIWLVPDRAGPTFARLRRLIEALARECGGDLFDPHVTLVGSLAGEPAALARRTRGLAASLGKLDLELGPVVSRPLDPNRFRRFFCAVEPAGAIKGANAAARSAFAAQGGDAYEPHLSLAYADVGEVGFAALKSLADQSGVAGVRLSVDTLELWRTEGAVADWRLAGVFPLGGPS